jgi:hypothetical protein
MRILGLDPGGSTGWCFFGYQESDPEKWTWSGDTITLKHHHSLLRALIQRYMPDYIVCEDFQFRQKAGTEDYRKGLELISREYIGIARLAAQDMDAKFILQPSSMKDTNLTRDENLEKLGILRTPLHPNRHYHDACRHTVNYIIQKRRFQPFIDRIKSAAA